MPTVRQLRLKSFCCIFYSFYFISFVIGAITKETLDESIFLAEISFVIMVLAKKVWMLLWKQKQIMGLLNRICVFSIRNDEAYESFNCKVEKLMRFVIAFACITVLAVLGNSIFPFVGNERSMIVDIAFPLDWKNSEIGFWLVYIFFFTENLLSILAIIYVSAIIWYLLLHCSLRYDILATDIRNMGKITGGVKVSQKTQHAIFYQDLVACIKDHLHLRGYGVGVKHTLSCLDKKNLFHFKIDR